MFICFKGSFGATILRLLIDIFDEGKSIENNHWIFFLFGQNPVTNLSVLTIIISIAQDAQETLLRNHFESSKKV